MDFAEPGFTHLYRQEPGVKVTFSPDPQVASNWDTYRKVPYFVCGKKSPGSTTLVTTYPHLVTCPDCQPACMRRK